VRLLLDEMYSGVIASQLRDRGRDVVSIHDPEYRGLEGASDAEVVVAALAERRAIVTENVPDYRRLEAAALARGEPFPPVIYTTNRQFPRGAEPKIGRLVEALDSLLAADLAVTTVFLEPAD